jgi:predicted transposase YbfD/YdcC
MTATTSNRRSTSSVLGPANIGCCWGKSKSPAKSNEITAIPALLKLLDISGCIITLDAMGTQKEIAREIIGHGADYVLCLKANHPTLWAEVTAWFEQAEAV